MPVTSSTLGMTMFCTDCNTLDICIKLLATLETLTIPIACTPYCVRCAAERYSCHVIRTRIGLLKPIRSNLLRTEGTMP
jgi:hypothetical protein